MHRRWRVTSSPGSRSWRKRRNLPRSRDWRGPTRRRPAGANPPEPLHTEKGRGAAWPPPASPLCRRHIRCPAKSPQGLRTPLIVAHDENVSFTLRQIMFLLTQDEQSFRRKLRPLPGPMVSASRSPARGSGFGKTSINRTTDATTQTAGAPSLNSFVGASLARDGRRNPTTKDRRNGRQNSRAAQDRADVVCGRRCIGACRHPSYCF